MDFDEPFRKLRGRERAMQDPRFGDPRWSPAGFVFVVTEKDIDEQLKTLLFGYPKTAWPIISRIIVGTPVFLFDMHYQLFHGIFEATTPGTLNIDPLASGGTHRDGSPFPAQVQCKYHFKFPPTPRWMFQKVPGLFFDGTLRIDRLLNEDQVQRMYDIFNKNNDKVMQNLAAASLQAGPHGSLPLPPQLSGPSPWPGGTSQHLPSQARDRDVIGQGGGLPMPAALDSLGRDSGRHSLPLPWDAPRGPKPFGILHDSYTNVKPSAKYKNLPHHYAQRPPPSHYKPPKLVDRADDGRNTTVQLANIPLGLTADQCVDSLDRAGFFASYDYLRFKPTLNEWPTRFGQLVVNMTSRRAAEAVFDEVDKITAGWPPFKFPGKQVPVRWAKLQGLQELYPALADSAFHLSGLPGGWAIPDEGHVFFKLPEDPHRAREEQRANAVGRERPDEAAWANAYQCGLEAGLDDEAAVVAPPMLERPSAWNSLPVPPVHSLPAAERDFLPGQMTAQRPGSDTFEANQLLPPPPARGVHLKRSFHATHDQAPHGNSKRHKSAPVKIRAVPISTSQAVKIRAVPVSTSQARKPYRHGPLPKTDASLPKATAEELKKQDLERRLNSALGSRRSGKGSVTNPPPAKQPRAVPQSSSHQPKRQAAEPKHAPAQSSSILPAEHSSQRKHTPIPHPSDVLRPQADSEEGEAVTQELEQAGLELPGPPPRPPAHRHSKASLLPDGGSLKNSEDQEWQEARLRAATAPAEQHQSQAPHLPAGLDSAELPANEHLPAADDSPSASSSASDRVNSHARDQDLASGHDLDAEAALQGELEGRQASPADVHNPEQDPPGSMLYDSVDAPKEGSKGNSHISAAADFDFGANFIPLF